MEIQQYLDKIKEAYWGSGYKSVNIQILEEVAGSESEDFLNFFD